MPLSSYIPSSVTAFEQARAARRQEEEQKIRSLAAMAQIAQRQKQLSLAEQENRLRHEATLESIEARKEAAADRAFLQGEAIKQRRLAVQTRAQTARDVAASRSEQAQATRDLRKEMHESSQGLQRSMHADRMAMQAQVNFMKLGQQAEKTLDARRRVSGHLGALSSYYDELDAMGGIANVEKGSLQNIWAGVKSSGIGQAAGSMLGTQEQSWRNKINTIRPLMIQEFRRAVEMGAKGLDSDRELTFYLEAATNPARDIQSNRAALKILEEAYGVSGAGGQVKANQEQMQALRDEFARKAGIAPAPAPQTSSETAPEGVDPKLWNVMTPEEKALWR